MTEVLAARVIVETLAAHMLASRRDCAAVAKQLQARLDELAPTPPSTSTSSTRWLLS